MIKYRIELIKINSLLYFFSKNNLKYCVVKVEHKETFMSKFFFKPTIHKTVIKVCKDYEHAKKELKKYI